ncbi:DUF2244 domain-containing protein [Marivivens donghaensis]|uniref:DUF2244 domain-containing protein n=1 Tax=Marivivens donghaensis TaxID=1699413 RepID=A0ABX0VZQ6_9RHOB|nr:DUF2244 domain-containing protein [Marivivens donghaensis]NIY72132.1 DUF2244 domain-containing protein [Marivivens donghaensis]
MPYEWIAKPEGDDAPVAELHLWPYRSLPKSGFVWFVGGTIAFLSVPLIAMIGTQVLWGLLPFIMLVMWALWSALQRSYKDGEVLEELKIWPDRMTLDRHNPRSRKQSWEATPYGVQITRHEKNGPVEEYLTMKGSNREVEIGSFLSVEERRALYPELLGALSKVR